MGEETGIYPLNQYNLDKLFPNLSKSGYSITSPSTPEYNCIAWSAGDTSAWWWPDPQNLYYWPPGIPRSETLQAFIKVYEILGFTICDNSTYKEGFEKIAIYADVNGKPTHAARQSSSMNWTSKLGGLEDIEHTTLDSLSSYYGSVVAILKRPKKWSL